MSDKTSKPKRPIPQFLSVSGEPLPGLSDAPAMLGTKSPRIPKGGGREGEE